MKTCRRIAMVVVAVLALTGCSMDGSSLSKISEPTGTADTSKEKINAATALELPPAPRPLYAVGDTFLYSDDGILVQEQVVSATPDRVTWANDQGMIWTTSNDLSTPQRSWSSHPTLGRGRQTIIGNPQALFPLQKGNAVSYEVRGNSEVLPTGWRDEHRCVVLGQVDVEVSAARHTTFHISCQRKDHIEEFFYSPKARSYVLRVRNFGTSKSRKELVSLALSDDRTKNIPVAVQRLVAPKTHDGMAKRDGPMNSGMTNANHDEAAGKEMIDPTQSTPSATSPRVASLVSRLETILTRLETMSGGDHGDATMMKELDDKTGHSKEGRAGQKFGAHLASYRTVAVARNGWQSLLRKFPKELGDLEFSTTKFDAGNGKGTYIWLVAVSFNSLAGADKFCRKLKSKRQFCKGTRAHP
jgi:hypothetical protein